MPRNLDRRAPDAALTPRPPVELNETERELLARAVCLTRVSRFTRDERSKLVTLVLRLGYRIEGGL
ncbi:MAG TPA: hypothetical protein VK754_09770 [Propionibacteriaceae bacterium]|nr:hypothetical protein [Propionibacteriaceae bacterium]